MSFPEKLENRRERITQGRRGFWRFSDEEPTAEEINGKIADRLDLTPEQETEMLPLTEKLADRTGRNSAGETLDF